MRADLVAQSFNRQNRFHRMLTGHEILRLQLLPGTRRKTHTKVWQTFVPRARPSPLLRAVFGRQFRDGMQIPVSLFRSEKFRSRVERLPFFLAAFYPNLANTLVLPVGKQAYAVGAGFDRVEVVFHRRERNVFEPVLPHNESRLKSRWTLLHTPSRT